MKQGKLGVLGGMGPQATLLFYQMVLDHTAARFDQEHIPTLILSDTRIPDRTAAILAGDTEEVKAHLLRDAKTLESWGAAAIAIPCNTSHAFLPWLRERLGVPVVDMIGETAAHLAALGAKRVAVLATDGTLRMGLYRKALEERGMEAVYPRPELQRQIMSVIYDDVKGGCPISGEKLTEVGEAMRAMGCDRVVLACTELSVCRVELGLPEFYVDAMDVLARRCVEACGYPLR